MMNTKDIVILAVYGYILFYVLKPTQKKGHARNTAHKKSTLFPMIKRARAEHGP